MHLYKGNATHSLCYEAQGKERAQQCTGEQKNDRLLLIHSCCAPHFLTSFRICFKILCLHKALPDQPLPHVSCLCACPWLAGAGLTVMCAWTFPPCALSFGFRSVVHLIFPYGHEERGSISLSPGTPPTWNPLFPLQPPPWGLCMHHEPLELRENHSKEGLQGPRA